MDHTFEIEHEGHILKVMSLERSEVDSSRVRAKPISKALQKKLATACGNVLKKTGAGDSE